MNKVVTDLTITGIRNGKKEVTLPVKVTYCVDGTPMWVERTDNNNGKIYGAVGYIGKKEDGQFYLHSYNRRTQLTEVKGFENLEGIEKVRVY